MKKEYYGIFSGDKLVSGIYKSTAVAEAYLEEKYHNAEDMYIRELTENELFLAASMFGVPVSAL